MGIFLMLKRNDCNWEGFETNHGILLSLNLKTFEKLKLAVCKVSKDSKFRKRQKIFFKFI